MIWPSGPSRLRAEGRVSGQILERRLRELRHGVCEFRRQRLDVLQRRAISELARDHSDSKGGRSNPLGFLVYECPEMVAVRFLSDFRHR